MFHIDTNPVLFYFWSWSFWIRRLSGRIPKYN